MLDFRIATFLQLCETKSYTKTAKLLDITQPSVTQHIKYLQRRYQCKLFSYEGKTLRLTPEGEYLRRQAENMTRMSAKIEADLKRMGENPKKLRFGYPEELGETALANVLVKLLKQADAPEINLCIKPAGELVTMLENGQIDFLLTDAINTQNQFDSMSVGQVLFSCYADKNHVQAIESLSELTVERLLINETGASDRAVLENILEQKKMLPNEFQHTMTASNTASLRELTAAGYGIQFAYETNMKGFEDKVQKLDISNFSEKRPLVFLYQKSNKEYDNFKAFLKTFKKAWTETNA